MRFRNQHRFAALAVTLLAAVVAACASATPRANDADMPFRAQSGDSARTVYRRWDIGGFRTKANYVIRDSLAWDDFWSRAVEGLLDPPPQPRIDFREEMLLLIAAGPFHDDDTIVVDSIASQGEDLVVDVTFRVECMPGTLIGRGVLVVAVPRHSGEVHFREHVLRHEACGP